jgi:hypothetical protein
LPVLNADCEFAIQFPIHLLLILFGSPFKLKATIRVFCAVADAGIASAYTRLATSSGPSTRGSGMELARVFERRVVFYFAGLSASRSDSAETPSHSAAESMLRKIRTSMGDSCMSDANIPEIAKAAAVVARNADFTGGREAYAARRSAAGSFNILKFKRISVMPDQ